MSDDLDHHSDNLDETRRNSVRLWLRLFRSATFIEKAVRHRFVSQFQTTFPRFDVLALLDRHKGGLTMSELSERLLVSNGNITGLVSRLQKDGYVARTVEAADRRSYRIALTPDGKEVFDQWAEAHANWIQEFLKDVSEEEQVHLSRLMATIKESVASALAEDEKP